MTMVCRPWRSPSSSLKFVHRNQGELIMLRTTGLAFALGLAPTPVLAPTQTLTLPVTQDYHRGSARDTIPVDWEQIGGIPRGSARRGASGAYDAVTIEGDWPAGHHTVTLTYLNDRYRSPTRDSKLHVEGVYPNGPWVNDSWRRLWVNGAEAPVSLTVVSDNHPQPTPPQTSPLKPHLRGWDPGLLAAVRQKESGNKYHFVNPFGALGAYQMHESALSGIGWYVEAGGNYDQPDDWDGRFTSKANSFGVYSKQDFLGKPAAQDEAFMQFWEINWKKHVEAWGLRTYLGKYIKGNKINPAGLLAAMHLHGAWALRDYLQSGGAFDPGDYNGTTMTDYIRMFGGYYTPYGGPKDF
jgi:hypothetical protein